MELSSLKGRMPTKAWNWLLGMPAGLLTRALLTPPVDFSMNALQLVDHFALAAPFKGDPG